MLLNFKVNTIAMSVAVVILLGSIAAPYTTMFGRHYQDNKDFACCKGDQLVVHHYYTVNFFWMELSSGFTDENMGKALAGGCNIKCID